MARHRFKAVVLDLFDTLVRWDPGQLPTIEFQGRQVRSTVPWLLPLLTEAWEGTFELAEYLEAYHQVTEMISEERQRESIEITCHERFARTLGRCKLLPGSDLGALAEHLTRKHMAGVRSVTSIPPENAAVVRQVATQYKLGLLSNFDDSQTGREIISDTGVSGFFSAILISADVGLRKPHPGIFQQMLEMLELSPHEVLFVGDTPHEDVVGAKAARIPVAWLSGNKGPLPESIQAPDFIITKLTELPSLLDQ